MRPLLFTSLAMTGMLMLVGCKSSKPASGCSGVSDCAAGEVCLDASCERICQSDTHCDSGQICDGQICVTGVRGTPPVVTAVDGDPDGTVAPPTTDLTGSSATRRIRHRVTLIGQDLLGATVQLAASGSAAVVLALESTSSTQIVAVLPSDLTAGQYALTVSNAAGAQTVDVWLLQGETGADGSPDTATQVRDKLVTVDGTGSGIDADLLDGMHAADFATANHEHGRGDRPANPATSCADALASGLVRSGVVWIDLPNDSPDAGAIEIYCDQVTNGGGWAMLFNSVLGTNTLDFWNIPYADRLSRRGRPSAESNFYDGSLYLAGLRFMDVIEDLRGHAVVAMDAEISVPQNFDATTMTFFNPTLVGGSNTVMVNQFAGGWSSADYDGDSSPTSNCATSYNNVTQHYSSCWTYNLGSDADASSGSLADGSVGPHVSNTLCTELGLSCDGSAYSRARRIARFVRW